MKKTIQVNLSGQVFTLDEDAYLLLTSYLERISRLYDRSPGKEDIIQDIEARIAELFLERMKENKQVVDIQDVKGVVAILGNPEEFEEEAGEAEYSAAGNTNRHLFRDPDNRVVGGVVSGISQYFGIDPIWLRLAFAIALIFFGTGAILYIILWIIIPEAKTAAEKLQMRGEPVNIGSIGKTIEDELNELGKVMKPGGKGDKAARKLGSTIERLVMAILNVVILFLRSIGKVLGALFSSVGVIALISLLAVILGVADAFHFGAAGWSVSYSIYELGYLFFDSGTWYSLALIALGLILFCPFILLTYAGLVLLIKDFRVPYLAGSVFGMWLVGLGLSVFVGIATAHEFSKEEVVVDEMSLESLGVTSDTIRIELADDPFNISERRAYYANHDFLIKDENDRMIIGNVPVFVRPSRDGKSRVTVNRTSNGRSYIDAEDRADSIQYVFQADSNALRFNAYYSFPINSLYRAQRVHAIVEVTEGTVVYLAPGSQRIYYDIDNLQDYHDKNMVGHYWLMTSKGFTCVDCPDAELPDEDGKDDNLQDGIEVLLDIHTPEVNVNISSSDAADAFPKATRKPKVPKDPQVVKELRSEEPVEPTKSLEAPAELKEPAPNASVVFPGMFSL